MNDFTDTTAIDEYWQYIRGIYPTLEEGYRCRFEEKNKEIDWDNPQTALELNDVAVMMLIESERSPEDSFWEMNLDMVGEALEQGVKIQLAHPLTVAHLALYQVMIGHSKAGIQLAYRKFIELLQSQFDADSKTPFGLVYLPPKQGNSETLRQELLAKAIASENGNTQALILLGEVLRQAQFVFYSSLGLRFLQLSAQLHSDSPALNLMLGFSSLLNRQEEGLYYLHRARELAPESPLGLQALYLAYRGIQQPQVARYWLEMARKIANSVPKAIAFQWRWTELEVDAAWTYVLFEKDIILSVEASFRSLVTSVLLAEGDWFEAEMELWRDRLQPGMVVIDVGANVGVYTFSAARRVGDTGRVLAIEPSPVCVECLEETCRVNEFSWVSIHRVAASDRLGTVRFAIHTASEVNQVIATDTEAEKAIEVESLTLDSLVEQEQLQRVDWLKIDAEGHELQVLAGGDRLLQKFRPCILYENIAGSQPSNVPVAEFLWQQGYKLFHYQPCFRRPIPINSLPELDGKLNIIALPETRPE